MPARSERKDAIKHRQLILKTAEELFERHGVNAVSMHQIAKCAGIGQGTLYRRYAHKGDLCMEMIRDASEAFIRYVDHFLKEHADLSAEERLGSILDRWIEIIEKKADLIMTIEAHQLKSSAENKAATFFQSPLYQFIRERMSELLAEIAAKRGEESADPKMTAHALICSLSPHGYLHLKQEAGYTTEQMKNNYRLLCRLPPLQT